ncbi:dihydrofolate reductase family protein [Catalinimonas sp. 4WD22]|uniref:dihydrofolate reductase family protein n=1 Tax=Catalinimonas locisalis TaxID=3133978 RepID=UPI0031014B68
MRKIILDLAATLDGFIEGPNGEVDWCIMDKEMKFDTFLSGIDTILYGRISYEMWGNYQPDQNASATEKAIWAAVHDKQKIVFSTKAWEDQKATYIHADIVERVTKIKQESGKDIWLYGGAKLITTFVNLGLIDEYRVSVHPTVLGAGKPLFEHLHDRLNLKLMQANQFKSGVIQLIYQAAE